MPYRSKSIYAGIVTTDILTAGESTPHSPISKMVKPKASKVIKSKASEPVNTALSVPPSWPKFKPPLPVIDLVPETLVEDKVVVFRNFWPRSLCTDYVSFLNTLPLATTPGKPKRGEAVRVNDRYQISDAAFASRLWLETGLKDAVMDESLKSLRYVLNRAECLTCPQPRL
jgi:hypothetical protein